MKKSFYYYLAAWAVMLTVWCVAVFLVRPVLGIYEITYDARFWVAWISIVIAFLGNLICAYVMFKSGSLQKLFYNIRLISISCSALIVLLVIGVTFMLIPNFPAWVTGVTCIIIIAINVVAVLSAAAVADAVAQIDEKIKNKTVFIKNLTIDAESIMTRAKSEEAKEACRKVLEEIRYSDPVSNPELSVIEAKITVKMDELSGAIDANNEERVKELAVEVIALVGDRNIKARALK